MIRNKVFYSLSADNDRKIEKKNRFTYNPEETTSRQQGIPNSQPLQYNTYSITANKKQKLAHTPNPQEIAGIHYVRPVTSYEVLDYKSLYSLPQASATYAFN